LNIAKPRIIQKSLKRHRKCLIKYQKLHSATYKLEMVPLVYIDECLLLPILYNHSRLSSLFKLYEQASHHALNMAVDEFRKYVPQPIVIVRPKFTQVTLHRSLFVPANMNSILQLRRLVFCVHSTDRNAGLIEVHRTAI
jgi:hypothetical protein